MIYFGGLGGVILLFLWVYALIDLITTDEVLTRNLPKGVWLLIVIFIPPVGPLLWLIAGRPEGASLRPGGTASSYGTQHPAVRRRLPPAPLGPEDSPDFIASIGEREQQLDDWEQDLRRREEELRRREDDDGPSDPSPA